jgi:hypothetical protein
MPGLDNPGPGDYITPRQVKPAQLFTSNMSSRTQRGLPLHTAKNPSPTAYTAEKYKSIEHPFISGGAPSNQLSLMKFEEHLRQKAANPFSHAPDYSAKDKNDRETAKLGPGMYSPQGNQEIGGTFLEREQRAHKRNRNSDASMFKSTTDASSVPELP